MRVEEADELRVCQEHGGVQFTQVETGVIDSMYALNVKRCMQLSATYPIRCN